MILPEGYTYYIDSLNTYHTFAIVPYSSYQYRVEVLFPVSPISVPTEVEKPAVTIKDFTEWVHSAEMMIQDENDALYGLTILLIEIARDIVEFDTIYDNVKMFKRAVSYYVAHYLELHLKTMKDEQNKMSFNPEKKGDEIDVKQMNLVDSHYGDFRKTLWGQMYWAIYGHTAKFNMTGVY